MDLRERHRRNGFHDMNCSGPRHLIPGVAKHRDPGVLFCTKKDGASHPQETRSVSEGQSHCRRHLRLSSNIARDSTYSCAWSPDAPFLAQALGRVSVSRRLG